VKITCKGDTFMLITSTLQLSLADRLHWKISHVSLQDHRRKLIDSSFIPKNMVTASEMTMLHMFMSSCDHETYEHSYRTAHTAQEVAHYLQLSQEEVCLVYLAALLHDIGKVAIPGAILNKRGPLNNEEQKIMRLHPQIGQDLMVQAGGVFGQLAAIVVAHHERWDGLGYPGGLEREHIPLLARILAVVDSFDAMTSSRGYRRSLSEVAAYRELANCAGSQYDPRVVAAFLSIRDTQIAPDTGRMYPPLIAWLAQASTTDALYA
jgi:putative nucleotidyltransferase with HDIG domain